MKYIFFKILLSLLYGAKGLKWLMFHPLKRYFSVDYIIVTKTENLFEPQKRGSTATYKVTVLISM